MLADLHAHYPMHVVADVTPRTALDSMRRVRGRPFAYDKTRALTLKIASRLLSDRTWWSGYRITVPYLREGDVTIAFSVLYRPFEEMDLSKRYDAPPNAGYFTHLLNDLRTVEDHVATAQDPTQIRVAHNRSELDASLAAGATVLVHCVEGGFHLGDTPRQVADNVAILAGRGVAYITVAHLFFRQVATNAPAIPFLPYRVYDLLFPQRGERALTERGEALVRAMVKHRVIVDLSHMRDDAIAATFALLDRIDQDRTLPVISSHAGYRFERNPYMHDDATIKRIAERDGVIGLIMAQHQLNQGVRRRRTKTLDESLQVICAHIDKIHEVTGSHRHVAIGSDLDGFIKPTMGGIEDARAMRPLKQALEDAYPQDARLITRENALRVLRKAWP